jgi:hypothetical protein
MWSHAASAAGIACLVAWAIRIDDAVAAAGLHPYFSDATDEAIAQAIHTPVLKPPPMRPMDRRCRRESLCHHSGTPDNMRASAGRN